MKLQILDLKQTFSDTVKIDRQKDFDTRSLKGIFPASSRK